MNQSGASPANTKAVRTIIRAGLIAGVLDALAAMTMVLIRGGKDPLLVWKFVASGVFGKEALARGTVMIIWGLAFHFFIALSFAALFYLIYPQLRRFIGSPVAMGLLYGILVWVIMNLLVLPVSRVTTQPFEFSRVVIGASILMVCIGLPIALIVSKSQPRQ